MYSDYYAYSAQPFQLNPDPRFFFGSDSHRRALSYLRYGLSRGEGFIVVTGGIGMGKTTLVKSLWDELDPRSVVAAQIVNTQLDADELLRMVCSAFGLGFEGASKAALLNQLEGFFRDRWEVGQRLLLLVDEAQNLSISALEELRMLSNLGDEKPYLQSFLLGQVEFRKNLMAPSLEQLRQRVIAACHLDPLSPQETRDYVEHRLTVVGWSGENPHIEEEVFDTIYDFSQGIPRKINVFCDRLLLAAFLDESQAIDQSDALQVLNEFNSEANPSLAEPAASAGEASGYHGHREANHAFDQQVLQPRLKELEQITDSFVAESAHIEGRLDNLERRLRRLEAKIDGLAYDGVAKPPVAEAASLARAPASEAPSAKGIDSAAAAPQPTPPQEVSADKTASVEPTPPAEARALDGEPAPSQAAHAQREVTQPLEFDDEEFGDDIFDGDATNPSDNSDDKRSNKAKRADKEIKGDVYF